MYEDPKIQLNEDLLVALASFAIELDQMEIDDNLGYESFRRHSTKERAQSFMEEVIWRIQSTNCVQDKSHLERYIELFVQNNTSGEPVSADERAEEVRLKQYFLSRMEAGRSLQPA